MIAEETDNVRVSIDKPKFRLLVLWHVDVAGSLGPALLCSQLQMPIGLSGYGL